MENVHYVCVDNNNNCNDVIDIYYIDIEYNLKMIYISNMCLNGQEKHIIFKTCAHSQV